ncbi:hypothetical protein [Microvirga splendida]|uniref:Uncharacterized protein n=1 Tax=Microvirga splendida TaxID=2795727 RepID=A0ABS0Y6Z1_9HYPH|nr:hypothetical protein [Microvirga splendida]MBJ6127653.1 hypothetical protein [Microvirga splendida]
MSAWEAIEHFSSEYMFSQTIAAAAISYLIGRLTRAPASTFINLRVTTVLFSGLTLIIGYFGFYHSHMASDPGVGTFLRWSLGALLLAPQIILALIVLYANVILRVWVKSYKGMAILVALYACLNFWSYFILTNLH